MGILNILIGALLIVFTAFIGLKIIQAFSKERFVDVNTTGINPASGIAYDPTCPAGRYSSKTGGICTGDPAKTSSPTRPPGTPPWFQSTPGDNPAPPFDSLLDSPLDPLDFPPLKPPLIPQSRPDISPNLSETLPTVPSTKPPPPKPSSPTATPTVPSTKPPPSVPSVPTPTTKPTPAPSTPETSLGCDLNELNVTCPSGDKPKISFVRNTKNATSSIDINTMKNVQGNSKPCPQYGTGGGYNFDPSKEY
jgi:hypothetical protein